MDTAEQQAALSKENCLFCQIVSGRIPARKVYEDDACIGILDLYPANAGHVLLMAKEHYIFMPQVPKDVLDRLASALRIVAKAALRAVQGDGTTIFIANGGLAGQKAPHFMIHVIPRLSGDGLPLAVPEAKIAPEVQQQVKAQLAAVLAGKQGLAPPSVMPAGTEAAQVQPVEKSDLDAITDMLAGDKDA